MVGQGFPDLLTCHKGVLRLVEIKDGSKPPSARSLTPSQEKMRQAWPISVVTNEQEALEAHGITVVA